MLTNNNPLPTLNLGFTDFFHMKNVPFNPSIEVTALCPTAQFQYSLGRLVYAASNRLFAVVTSDVGCGKSTLLRALASTLDPDKYLVLYVSQSHLSPRWLYNIPLEQMGMETKFYSTDAKKAFHDCINREMAIKKKTVVMIIDEAHLASNRNGYETLEEIRFLLNCKFDAGNPLCLILAGQEELWEMLSSDKGKAICQRIDITCSLPPLDDEQVRAYIAAHLRYAQVTDTIFNDGAINAISNASKGVPRLINKICTHVLLYAATQAITCIDENMVNDVVKREIPPCLL
ncbi:MAG: AAA family ATPase [Succinatimonas sp.]|jgi:type II secretory pathway predicted ATPase ExeA|nr:AAA family ATPase [Succinatimonas sp.]MDY5722021.1 AAA family ATPase [Succinivibrio sp.]